MKLLPLPLILCIVLFACSNEQPVQIEKAHYNVEIELSDSRVIKLNGKEIHVDLLPDQLETLTTKYTIHVVLKVAPNAPFGIVHDIQRIMISAGIQHRA
jgi:biopolymer transport protein ExbD